MTDDVARLRADVTAIATSDGRCVGTRGHEAAKGYLLERMSELRLRPYRGAGYELTYESERQTFANLVGVVAGRDSGLAPVLIGAHYDSVIPSCCADDNAAAVAIALLAAERLGELVPRRDVVIALFDAEEPPYFLGNTMGSTRFYCEQRRPDGFHAALIMDLVGHDVELAGLQGGTTGADAAGLLFMTGAESHAALPQVVRDCIPGPQLPVVATLNRNVGDMSDHHVFRLSSVPYLFLSCGRWEHYHRESDTPDRLNYEKMHRISQLVVRLCERLAETEMPPSDRAAAARSLEDGVTDTTGLEIELIERALGDSLPLILAATGLKSLGSRRDLDHLASMLQGLFDI